MGDLNYRMIYIGGAPAGLLGLEELFAALYEAGHTPEDTDINELLLRGVRQHNFVPKSAVPDYQMVIGSEYQKYYQKRSGGEAVVPRDYGQWEGYPREQIPWFPVVSAELCNGCLKCIEVCPKDVFSEEENGKVAVVEPFLCIVGCCFCRSACDPEAILMPNKEMLDQFRHGQRHAT
jgi:NAD-dependent dihydropyrimidine dehydrogenase PreA subunit